MPTRRKVIKEKIKFPIDIWNYVQVSEKARNPVIRITIANKEYQFLIDTGASLSFICSSVVNGNKQLTELPRIINEDRLFHGIGGVKNCPESITIPNFKIGSKSIKHDFILEHLKEGAEEDDLNYDGILGFDIIWKYDIRFDYRNYCGYI